mmetsp:Transcript_5812/g.9943  ORF Transcript_5812/g.9943 Transcript_5812/m.9943 type:complete len:183 (-) Transcript_5812:114-662(-)
MTLKIPKKRYVYPYFRIKPNQELEKLHDKHNLRYRRELYQNMPVDLEQFKNDKEEFHAEDFQDESKLKELMNNVLCLTENEIKYQEEQNKRKIIVEQKNNLVKLMGRNARKIYGELHRKTHSKGATSLVMSDTRVMSLEEGQTSNQIKQVFQQIDEKLKAETAKPNSLGLRKSRPFLLAHQA